MNPVGNSGFVRYTEEQKLHIKYNLEKSLGPEYVSFRAAAGGSQVVYIEGWKALNLANQIFGFNGWSSEIKSTQVDYVDHLGGKWSLGLSVVVRVTLKDGTFHEDIGYGNIENCKSKAMAFDKAKKEAVTDGIKRALRQFGNVLGNCLYEKNYLQKVKKIQKIEKTTTEDQLLRPEDNIKPEFDRNGHLVRKTEAILPQKVSNGKLPLYNKQQVSKDRTVLNDKQALENIIPEDSYMEDSFLFSDDIFEEDANGIADHEMELLLDKNNKSPPQNVKTPEPSRFAPRPTALPLSVAFVSTRLARDIIETAPGLSPLPTDDKIAFNALARTPLHNKTMLDQTKSAPIKRTPLTNRKVIYGSSKKPLAEDLNLSQTTQENPPQSMRDSPTPSEVRPLEPIKHNNNNNIPEEPLLAQKRSLGQTTAPNKRAHRVL